MMRMIHILGRQKNGKTTLIVDLINEFKTRGIQVGTLKHSSHSHELDKPGKDSFLHRKAGACPAAIATKDTIAVYLSREPEKNPFDKIKTLFSGVDLILIEGYISGPGKKIEVWRKAAGTAPISSERNDIEALITDDPLETTLPVWPRSDIRRIADQILALTEIE